MQVLLLALRRPNSRGAGCDEEMMDAATAKLTDDGSAVPRSIADPSASVWLAKSGIAIFYIINVDCAERGLRLL
jgi:hypothetical protein